MIALGLLALFVCVFVATATVVSWRKRAHDEQVFAGLQQRLAREPGTSADHHALGLHLADQNQGDEALAHLEMAAAGEPSSLMFGNDLRMAQLRFHQSDRGIAFFENLAAAHPGLPQPSLQAALSYVDKMPDNMMGIVGQGRLSKLSIARLDRLLEKGHLDPPENWAVLYALGMNHLYWPKALGHAPQAIDAFEKCIHLEAGCAATGRRCLILPYLALGDAYVKAGRPRDARRTWSEARDLFGSDPRLEQRLGIEDDAALTEWVDVTRGLGVVVDTDLSVLWRP